MTNTQLALSRLPTRQCEGTQVVMKLMQTVPGLSMADAYEVLAATGRLTVKEGM